MESFVLLAYASLAASRTLLQQLLACLNFTLESEDFSLWYKRKKWFLWTMAAAQAAENHGDEWDLTWYFLWGIYTPIPTWTHSQNSLASAEAPGLKINSHGTFLKWSQRPSQSARDSHTLCYETGIPLWIWWKANRNRDNNMIRIFQWTESHCRTKTSIWRNK